VSVVVHRWLKRATPGTEGACHTPCMSDPDEQRFLTLADVAAVLNISVAQTYALVRRGELRAIKVGGRGQWRVEAPEVDTYVAKMYERAAQFIQDHPFAGDDLANDVYDDLLVD
jgi:excisionase family DNA binding protein